MEIRREIETDLWDIERDKKKQEGKRGQLTVEDPDKF